MQALKGEDFVFSFFVVLPVRFAFQQLGNIPNAAGMGFQFRTMTLEMEKTKLGRKHWRGEERKKQVEMRKWKEEALKKQEKETKTKRRLKINGKEKEAERKGVKQTRRRQKERVKMKYQENK